MAYQGGLDTGYDLHEFPIFYFILLHSAKRSEGKGGMLFPDGEGRDQESGRSSLSKPGSLNIFIWIPVMDAERWTDLRFESHWSIILFGAAGGTLSCSCKWEDRAMLWRELEVIKRDFFFTSTCALLRWLSRRKVRQGAGGTQRVACAHSSLGIG